MTWLFWLFSMATCVAVAVGLVGFWQSGDISGIVAWVVACYLVPMFIAALVGLLISVYE